jgi:hypothetical protein
MAFKKNLSDAIAIVGTIDPQDYTAATATTTLSTDIIDISSLRKVMFVVGTGQLGVACAVDFKVYKGTCTGTITTSVGAITQLTAGDDNKQAIYEVDYEDLGSTYKYIIGKLVLTNGGAGDNEGVMVLALADIGRFPPDPDILPDLASVDEIVTT